jgi:hypothetical protein
MADHKPRVLALDMEFTNGELEIIEDHARMTFGELAALMKSDDGIRRLPFRAITALTFVALRRVKPDATIAEVQAAKPGDFDLEIVGGDADPLSPNAEPSA